MKEVIAVFGMKEIKLETRITVLEKLGKALDMEYGMNWTGEIIGELTDILKKEIIERERPF